MFVASASCIPQRQRNDGHVIVIFSQFLTKKKHFFCSGQAECAHGVTIVFALSCMNELQSQLPAPLLFLISGKYRCLGSLFESICTSACGSAHESEMWNWEMLRCYAGPHHNYPFHIKCSFSPSQNEFSTEGGVFFFLGSTSALITVSKS